MNFLCIILINYWIEWLKADYKQSICELDEKMFMTARLVALELRNHYVNELALNCSRFD